MKPNPDVFSPTRPHAAASRWLAEDVAAIGVPAHAQTIPVVGAESEASPIPGIDLWDLWPAQLPNGEIAKFDGWEVWFVLSAQALPDPDLRHGIARIRLMTFRAGTWRDCGDALPDGFAPGSREWAGSSVYEPASGSVTLYFTAAGNRGEAKLTFAQRMFQTCGQIAVVDGKASVTNWSALIESVVSDGKDYLVVDQTEGAPGFIKGFRDPAHFRDPANGNDYLLFTGSVARSTSDWNGCIGIAQAANEECTAWALLSPLLVADGLNNEQERPHVVCHGGLYYLFWSTQRKVFAPGGPNGPNGLYGMVAQTLFGPYEPLNGTGLVAGNPEEERFQTYSWWVTSELEVAGFVDLVGVGNGEPVDDPEWRRAHFGGVPAPRFRIALDGTRAWVVE